MKCSSALPTNFQLIMEKAEFKISKDNFSLFPGKTDFFIVSFNPKLKLDKMSGEIKSKLSVNHTDHPYVQVVNCTGVVNFPNVELS